MKTRHTFPQADSMERILATVRVSAKRKSPISISELSSRIGVTERQAFYYASGAAHLGLVSRDGGVKATIQGRSLMKTRSQKARRQAIAGILDDLPVFKRALRAAKSGRPASREAVSNWIIIHMGLSRSTAARRAATVQRWVAAAV